MTYPHGGASQIWRDEKGAAGVVEQPTRPNGDPAQESDPYNPPKSKIRDWGTSVENGLDGLDGRVGPLETGAVETVARCRVFGRGCSCAGWSIGCVGDNGCGRLFFCCRWSSRSGHN